MNYDKYLWQYLTREEIAWEIILPFAKRYFNKYIFVDMYAGEGNLIFPLIETLSREKRNSFFKDNVYLFDVDKEMVERSILKAVKLGVAEKAARENIRVFDSALGYPDELKGKRIIHITNPPYKYIGEIRKNDRLERFRRYFVGENSKLQDLYQISLVNDVKAGADKMVYVLPVNFLFGDASSNLIREIVFDKYIMESAFVVERQIFSETGINVAVCFFSKRTNEYGKDFRTKLFFSGQGILYATLRKEDKYKINGLLDFYKKKQANFDVSFYLTYNEIKSNRGSNDVELVDANGYNGRTYGTFKEKVNDKLYDKIKSNILFIRTIDDAKGKYPAGIYEIKDFYDADGIVVTRDKHRTQPIQLFFNPPIAKETQLELKKYVNDAIQKIKHNTFGAAFATYRYNAGGFARKYIGLKQFKQIIENFDVKKGDKV